ncbi:EexN family lipoprotein [Serratia marcescens]|uniref:EexN family lipoprotein n=1 Tax=Serratia TaxID=613 RepID=UPI0018E7580B|nr:MULTISPECIES: EexN family lipoprotein [Serratia]MBJ2083142.1 EexN family lipoprotein [Serratia ureilytica]MCW6016233.1 EexN family lipoprotein [Serratia marcescens]MDP0522324.1 EexN family lipoprotein [Serratia marcescens]
MSKWIAIFLSGVAFLLAGCEDKAKSVDWYMEHPTELAVVFKDCKASGDDTQNCRNAKDANFRLKQRDAKLPTFGDLSSDKK